MAGVGLVTVSLRRSTTGRPMSGPATASLTDR